VTEDHVERAGRDLRRCLAGALQHRDPGAHVGRFGRERAGEPAQQIRGDVQPGDLVSRPGKKQGLCPLSAADVQDPDPDPGKSPSREDLRQLSSQNLLA